MAESAPYRSDLADGPDTRAVWLTTSDGVRIRAGHAAPGEDAKGTVFVLPGRSEYLEKYGLIAHDLVGAGFHVASIDWRGQGLADRMGADPMVGHVDRFLDFQKDLTALIAFARSRDLPRPWHMLAHSMGGCIGLRALLTGANVTSVVFTGPMWGISISQHLRPAAWIIPTLACALGQGQRIAPGLSIKSYLSTEPFEGNLLTTDRGMWDYMKRQVDIEPRFGLGGPSLSWLGSALKECRALAKHPSPAVPALCFVGSKERIVDTQSIRKRMTGWPGGKLLLVDGAEHEVMMEKPGTRRQVTGSAISLFSSFAS